MAGPELDIAVAAGKVLFSKTSYDFLTKWGIDSSLLETLETQFIAAKALLNVADMTLMEQGSYHYKLVWKLRYAILDAEDLLDTIHTDINMERCRLGDSLGTLSLNVIKEKIRYKGNEINRALHPFKKIRETKMIQMIQQLQSIMPQVVSLNLDKCEALTKFREDRIVCSSSTNPLSIVGRSNDEINIMNLLNPREGNGDKLRVISITGMGGVGKTTLASMVYNGYQTLDQVFEVKGWVCVSDEFKSIHVIKSLLECIIEKDSEATTNLEAIQKELKEKLQGKRFLLVLDDIWEENDVADKWESLLTIFSVGAPGSKIIVTTRAEQVATMVSKSLEFIYNLDGLSDGDCWSLFESLALPDGKSRENPRLEKIGRELVSRCKGLPLAVKMLGRALLNKKDELWDSALHSKIWESTSKIIPSLWFSYCHLPPQVKQCFGYFSMFPKDYVYFIDKMVMLWVSEGFIEKPRESSSDDYEFVARSYFDHLIDNFFIEQSSITESGFVMHDLIHDLAEFVSKELVVDFTNINSKERRLPYIQVHKELFDTALVRNLPHLRTYRLHRCTDSYIFTVNKCNTLLSSFKQLRVLSLKRYYDISVLPASIKGMKLLRYLNLSGTQIRYLPEWICGLYNLQVLKVSFCFRLKRFPKGFDQLTNLRHLIAKNVKFREIPYGIRKMKSLRTIPDIFVIKGRSKELRELSELGNLNGLKICDLNNVDDEQDVVIARIGNKEYLEELVLIWNSHDPSRDANLDERVLDAVQPCGNLKRLTIETFYGKRLANWMMGDSPALSNMVILRLINCRYCEALPSLGSMRCLKSLIIQELYSLEYIGIEFYGNSNNPFPSLQELSISTMRKLIAWSLPVEIGKKGFCSLKEVEIKQCGKLISIPYCYPNLAKLKIDRCSNLVKMQMHGAKEKGSLLTSRPYGYSLQSINITSCPMLEEIPKCFVNLTKVHIIHCESLVLVPIFNNVQKLYLLHVGDLIPPEGAIQNSIMEELTIESASTFKLMKLLSEEMGIFSRFNPLKTLTLKVENKGISSDDDTEEMSESQEDREVVTVLPPRISILKIIGLSDSRIVTQLSQIKCLTSLTIRECHALVSLPDLTSLSMLRTIEIGEFISLRTFPDGFLSGCAKQLNKLNLINFPNLTCLPEVFSSFDALQSLRLECCPLIQCFPTSSDSTYSCLSFITIDDCPMLESLPGRFHNITTLRSVHLAYCPSLVFPEYGFPTTITCLSIKDCGKMVPVLIMNLSKLTSLEDLSLIGFPETVSLDGCIPASVQHLTIMNFPHLKFISGLHPTQIRPGFCEANGCPLLNKIKSGSKTRKDILTEFKSCLRPNSPSYLKIS